MTMNYETIEKTVELICEKFGIAIDSVATLIPSVTKYNIWMNIAGIFAAIALVAFVAVLIKFKDKLEEYDLDALCFIGVGLGIAAILALLLICVPNLIKWSCMPEIAFIEYVMNFLKQGG